MNDEYQWIRGYLNGEIDWEILVKEVGEDMARGVRIAQEHLHDEESGGSIEVDEDFKKKIGEDIMRGGYIAQAIQESYDLDRQGERQ